MADSAVFHTRCRRLEAVALPLANKFYRQHGSKMRARGDEAVWVAERQGICGALRLRGVGPGLWLTGLFTRPDSRNRGVASSLIRCALARRAAPVWLFCHPDLTAFYAGHGFEPCSQLPEELASRLTRYQRKQRLCALELPAPFVSGGTDNSAGYPFGESDYGNEQKDSGGPAAGVGAGAGPGGN